LALRLVDDDLAVLMDALNPKAVVDISYCVVIDRMMIEEGMVMMVMMMIVMMVMMVMRLMYLKQLRL